MIRNFLEQQLKKAGVYFKEGLSKVQLERLLSHNQSAVPQRELQPSNVRLKPYMGHRAHTFNQGNFHQSPNKAEGPGVVYSTTICKWLLQVNAHISEKQFFSTLLSQDGKTEKYLSVNGHGQIYAHSPGVFGGEQVDVLERYGHFVRIRTINPNFLPDPKQVLQDYAVCHLYNSWTGSKINYGAYPIYLPLLYYGEAWIEAELLA